MELKTPVSIEDVRKLRVGDIVYVTGTIVTARDKAHVRMLELLNKKAKLPFELNVVYHCGPLVVRDDGGWRVISAGPTTSARMNDSTRKLLRYTDVLVIVGKGGMDVNFEGKGVYLAYTGGCGALATDAVRRVIDVHWLDLGMPEAVWVLEVERFGPCVVAIDAHGNSLYEEVKRRVEKNFCRLTSRY